jgi:hypothetical protein
MRLDVKNTVSRDGDAIWKTVDQFAQTFWSGLDCRIFANDVFLEDVLELQWTLQEAVAPLFGYHDYTYSTVMHGARRVNGSFRINYTRESFIFELLRELENRPGTRTNRPTASRRSDAFEAAQTGRADLEYFTALAAGDGTPPRDSKSRPRFDPKLLKKVAEDFERAIWGEQPRHGRGEKVKSVVNELLQETSDRTSRFELSSRFNLNLVFGSVHPGAVGRRQSTGVTGSQGKKEVELPISTSTRIVGVCLTGYERVVDDSGRPIMETYQFIARDVL